MARDLDATKANRLNVLLIEGPDGATEEAELKALLEERETPNALLTEVAALRAAARRLGAEVAKHRPLEVPGYIRDLSAEVGRLIEEGARAAKIPQGRGAS